MVNNGRIAKFGAILFGSFAVVSGVAQILVIDSLILKYGTFTITIICGGVAYFFTRAARQHTAALDELLKMSLPDHQFKVGIAKSEAEFRETWNLEIVTFGTAAASIETALTLWNRYSKGLFVLRRDGELLGYIAFWPLTKTTFRDFLCGRRLEPQLSHQCIAPNAPSAPVSYWYVGSIALSTRFRKTRAIRELVSQAVISWLSSLNPDGEIHLCALAYSHEGVGEKMLRRFGFHKHADRSISPHKQSVYARISSVSGLSAEMKRVLSL